MPSEDERIERKNRLLEQLDPEHDVELDDTFTEHLAASIQASSPSVRQQALDKAIKAYENALDEALYKNGRILGTE